MQKAIYWGSLVVYFFLIVGSSLVNAWGPKDRLKDAYDRSHYIEAEPYASNLEASDVFQESNSFNPINLITGWGDILWLNDNVMVRFARFLMRMAVVLAVAMLIYSGIKIALAFGDSGKLQAALKDIGIVLFGVFLALASVAIVFVITSLMRGSLQYDFFNS